MIKFANGKSYSAKVLNVNGDWLESQISKGSVLEFADESYRFPEGKYRLIPRMLRTGEVAEWYLPIWSSEPAKKLIAELPSMSVETILKRLDSDDWGVVEELSHKLLTIEKSVIYEHRQAVPISSVQKLLFDRDHGHFGELYALILAMRNQLSSSVEKSKHLEEGQFEQLQMVEKFLHYNADSELPESAALGANTPSQYHHLKALAVLIEICPSSNKSQAAITRIERFAVDPDSKFSDLAIEHLTRLKRWNAVKLFDKPFIENANRFQLKQLRDFCNAILIADDATQSQKQLAAVSLEQM